MNLPYPQSTQIFQVIEKLRATTRIDVQHRWYSCTDISKTEATHFQCGKDWQVAQLNEKGHIAWSAGHQVLWLRQKFVIPQELQGYPLTGLTLRLVLTWWAEDAQIYVNDQLRQAGDLFDTSTRLLLSSAAKPLEEITVVLRLVSPGHDNGALVRSCCVYEHQHPSVDPGFVADELAVLKCYLETFAPEKLKFLTDATAEIDWEGVSDAPRFNQSLSTLRQKLLQSANFYFPTASKIYLLGHAHLDLAWLWPVNETWSAAQRTFESVLKLSQEFPDLIFCHSTPALYAWIEQHRPDLFSAIQQQVKAGRWEVVGGMWVEPELNLLNGESIARQLLYGQRYVQEKFHQLSVVAWLPDTFGFCATLPQLLKLGGIEYFVTQKLRWNDTTKFPDGVFWWQAPDGSKIFSLMSAPIGEGIDPIKLVAYSAEWETQTNLKDALWLPGVGDHGGGPTRDMLEVAKRWQSSPFFPTLEFTTAVNYLQQISTQLIETGCQEDSLPESTGQSSSAIQNLQSKIPRRTSDFPQDHLKASNVAVRSAIGIPIWNDELYLEFHRGCYTSHADQKRWHRLCEGLLYQAELFASLATISNGTPYPKAELEAAWKKVLFNQFHDILPGTSIPAVFAEANKAWQEAHQLSSEILNQSLKTLASQIAFPPPPQPEALPIVVFNSLNWRRSEVVAVPLPELGEIGQAWQIYDLEGQPLPSQLSGETPPLLFFTADVPAVGYRVFWLGRQAAERLDAAMFWAEKLPQGTKKAQDISSVPRFDSSSDGKKSSSEKDWVLENQLLRVIVNSKTGDLKSVFDKVNQRQVLNEAGGNQLQAFKDSGQYWDAWNIDPNYSQQLLPPTELKTISWIDQGQIQQRLRVVRELGKSEFCQDYVLSADSPVLKIVTQVDWQERHVLVKAAFPLNLQADFATYEIPCGAIQRTTQPQTSAEKAKWEVPALRWADLTQTQPDVELKTATQSHSSIPNHYGVSLLNDCKYGYDSQPNQLRLTLLRSPSWPDPDADQGHHEFTYALYPHTGSWQSAHTVRRGYELNFPLQITVSPPVEMSDMSVRPPVAQLLNLSADNLILMAFKQAETQPKQWILRCYECHGDSAELSLQSDLKLTISQALDLLERPIDTPKLPAVGQPIKIEPWKVISYQLSE